MTAAGELSKADTPSQSILGEAVRDAILTALIAFALFGSLVGFKTESEQSVLVLTTRWGDAIALTLAVAVGRFLLDVFVWRGLAPTDVIGKSLSFEDFKPVLKAAAAAFYIAGAAFFLLEGSRAGVEQALSSFAGTEWRGAIRTLVSLVGLLAMGVFVLITAMVVARLGRLAVRAIAPTAEGEKRSAVFTWQAITGDLMKEFAMGLLIVAILLPILVAGPQQRYAVDTAIQVVTYIMLGWGLNVVVGLAGLLDLGYVAFYAVGAYSYALIATQFGWSFWVCLPLAGIFAALWGILLGFPVLRLRGDYLAIVTLAFGEIIRVVLINWYSVTGGPNGINRIPQVNFFGIPFDRSETGFAALFGLEFSSVHRIIFFYYVILALALFTNVVTMRLRRLPIGRAWEAMREDEIACRSLGINIVTTKLSAFAIGAAFAGFAGSFFATRQGFISPESFTFHESALVLAIVVLGGLGSQMGVVIASIVLIGSSEFFRDLEEYRMLIFGGSMVALMTWRPRGLIATRTPSVILKESKQIAAANVQEGRG